MHSICNVDCTFVDITQLYVSWQRGGKFLIMVNSEYAVYMSQRLVISQLDVTLTAGNLQHVGNGSIQQCTQLQAV